jgi:myo-inositol-1(or 4)-monophosphatase
MHEMQTVMAEVAGIRRTGSAAIDLAWTAAGRFDGYWERNIKPWDMAAGIVIMREAGGLVCDLDGGDNMLAAGDVLAANKDIQKALLPLIGKPSAA